MLIAVYGLMGVAVLFLIWILLRYHKFTKTRSLVENDFQLMDVEMKKRHKIVKTFVQLSENIMGEGSPIIKGLNEGWNKVVYARNFDEKLQGEKKIDKYLLEYLIEAQNFEKLYKSKAFANTKEELISVEIDIDCAKVKYNQDVEYFNQLLEIPPGPFICKIFGFIKKPFFDDEGSKSIKPKHLGTKG